MPPFSVSLSVEPPFIYMVVLATITAVGNQSRHENTSISFVRKSESQNALVRSVSSFPFRLVCWLRLVDAFLKENAFTPLSIASGLIALSQHNSYS